MGRIRSIDIFNYWAGFLESWTPPLGVRERHRVHPHACIFCSSYGVHRNFYRRPNDHQVLHRLILRKVLELEPEAVEVQAEFEPLDPAIRHATLELVTELLDHGIAVKLFTHLVFPRSYIEEFFCEVVNRTGARSLVEEKLQIHTSCHAVHPLRLRVLWLKQSVGDVIRCFRTWLVNVHWLVTSGFYVGIHFVVTRLNIEEVFPVYTLALLLGIRQVSFLRLTCQGLAEQTWNVVAPTWLDWILIYAKFLRLIRVVWRLKQGDAIQWTLVLDMLRWLHEYLHRVYGIYIPCTNDSFVTDLRFGCPINWFFILLDSPIVKEDDPLLPDALRELMIYPSPRCSVVEGSHICIDVGGWFPCIGMKCYVRLDTLEQVQCFRRWLLEKYMSEECRSCPYFNICQGKCYAQKLAFRQKVDPLCRILKRYRDLVMMKSLNKYEKPSYHMYIQALYRAEQLRYTS